MTRAMNHGQPSPCGRKEATMELLKNYENTDELLSFPGVCVHTKLSNLVDKIASTRKPFKIGVAHDALKRWCGYTDRNGKHVPALRRDFQVMHVSVQKDNHAAAQVEIDLISNFKHHSLCLNVAKGGDNVNLQETTEPYFVYVAFKA